MTTTAASPRHVAIIGAGIVGVSTALWLQRDGHRVTLIDKNPPGEGTSHGNGGVLASCAMVPVTGPGLLKKAPGMLLDPDQPLFMKWGYLPRLLPWLRKYLAHANEADTRRIASAIAGIVGDSLEEHRALATGTGAEKWIVPADYMYLYKNRAAFEADALGWDIRATHGMTWDILEGAALRAFDRIYSPDQSFAVKMPEHGRIADPGKYVKALAAHVEDQGGDVVTGAVTGFVRDGARLTGITVGDQTLDCDAAVIATGIWSGPLARELGLRVPLESERGYHLELWEPSQMPKTPVMIAAGKFVATPMDGRLRLAGIVEFGGLDAPPSEPPFDLLRKAAKAAMPGLTWARETEWMGHRPAPADSIPVIGAVPSLQGAYTAFGHHHIGLTSGPKTGRLLAQIISGRAPNLDVGVYSPARFTS
ncbi:MAG: FAD-binding oxidoreductase [Pseudomonadota bacterium]